MHTWNCELRQYSDSSLTSPSRQVPSRPLASPSAETVPWLSMVPPSGINATLVAFTTSTMSRRASSVTRSTSTHRTTAAALAPPPLPPPLCRRSPTASHRHLLPRLLPQLSLKFPMANPKLPAPRPLLLSSLRSQMVSPRPPPPRLLSRVLLSFRRSLTVSRYPYIA